MTARARDWILFIHKHYILRTRSAYWRNVAKNRLSNSTELTNEEKAKIQKLYYPYLKGKEFGVTDVFHRYYKEKTGRFSELYLPDDLYYSYIDPYFNDWNSAKVIDNKCLYGLLWPEAQQPETIAVRIKGLWKQNNQMSTIQEVIDSCMSEKEVVIKKATGSEGGEGVFFCSGHNKDSILHLINTINCDIIIQKILKQHELMAALNASSINTIRILTLLRNNSVHVYSSVLRIGMNHSRVDNASGGGLTCGITEDGYLKKYAYKVNGECFIAHPDTGIVFEGHRIPGYESAIELVKKHAINLPQFRLVSWDIAINKDEKPVLLEANLKYGELDFHQLNNGPLFGKDTIDILNEVFQH